jgi:cellulose synthase/poly-beta-1,6-N-acetylglucosamine synthase-like glycosyltransferase
MRLPAFRRELVAIPALAVAVAGASALAYYAGLALAYLSLVFGVLFFAFAARYYVATISVLLAPSVSSVNGKNGTNGGSIGNAANKAPKVSVHVALYNEERVVDRLLTACSKLDYPNYEVVVVDDSNDGTVKILKEWILNQIRSDGQKIKIIHRDNRKGFKGGALNEALKHTDSKAEYVVVFDADFVPEPDIIKKFLAYFSDTTRTGTATAIPRGGTTGSWRPSRDINGTH